MAVSVSGLLFCVMLLQPRATFCLDLAGKGYLGSFHADEPVALTSDGRSRIFIASMWGKITVTDLHGNELDSFGGKGTGLYEVILEPFGISHYDGKLYVADSWYSHVVVLSEAGELLDVFGGRGTGRKQFMEPKGIYVHHGLIYVADSGNGRVQVLGLNGEYLMSLASEGMFMERVINPVGVLVMDDGTTFAVDSYDMRVKIFDIRGAYLSSIYSLRFPVDIGHAGEDVVVADSELNDLRFFTGDGNILGSLAPSGKNAKPFVKISSVTTVDKLVYSGDLEGNEIKVFSVPRLRKRNELLNPKLVPIARFMGESGLRGMRAGKVEISPTGGLYLLESDAGKIYSIAGEGGLEVVGPENCTAVSFAFGADGYVYCMDSGKKKIAVSALDGGKSREIWLKGDVMPEDPVDLVISSIGEMIIADRIKGDVLIYGPDGEYMGVLGQGGTAYYIKEPVALRISPSDTVYVADAKSRTVYIYSSRGRLLRGLWDVEDLKEIGGIAISEDYIFLIDSAVPDIKVFSREGMQIMSFGSQGAGKAEFESPSSLVVDADGSLIVADTKNNRLQRFGLEIDKEYVQMLWKSKSVKTGIEEGHKKKDKEKDNKKDKEKDNKKETTDY